MKRITASLLASFLLCVAAEARPVRQWKPKELFENSDAVVLATPVIVGKTEETGQIRLGKNPPLPVTTYKAKISVKYVLKGDTLNTLEFRYSPLDHTKLGDKPIVNRPGRIHLKKGAVYVFYLKERKKGEDTFFVGALEGEFDDNQAVVLVASEGTEPNAPTDTDKPRD